MPFLLSLSFFSTAGHTELPWAAADPGSDLRLDGDLRPLLQGEVRRQQLSRMEGKGFESSRMQTAVSVVYFKYSYFLAMFWQKLLKYWHVNRYVRRPELSKADFLRLVKNFKLENLRKWEFIPVLWTTLSCKLWLKGWHRLRVSWKTPSFYEN